MALPLPNTTAVQITRLTKALYNAAPGNTYMTAFTASAGTTTAEMTTFANWFAATVSTSAATLASTVVTNIGLTGDAATAGTAYLTAAFAADPSNLGKVILDAMNALSTLSSDATYGTAASTFNDSVATAYAYSINTDNTSTNIVTLQAADEPAATGTGQTFTLTTGVDQGTAFTGTSGDDIFVAVDAAQLQVSDVLVGGSGTDVLNYTNTGAAAMSAASISGIETINVRAVGNDLATTDLSLYTGVTTFNLDRSTNSADVTNMASGGVYGIVGNASVTNNDATGSGFGYAAAATAATLNVSGGTLGTNAVTMTGTGLLSQTINSTGAANVIGAFTGAASVTSTTVAATTGLTTGAATNLGATVTVTGAGAVSFGTTALQAGVTTLNASENTGGLTVALGTAVTQTVTGSTGNDVITTGAVLTTGSVAAGTGTDTLVCATMAHINTAALGAKYTGFETLRLTHATANTVNMGASLSGITAIQLGGDATLTNLTATQAAAITIRSNAVDGTADDMSFALASSSGTSDVLTIVAGQGTTTTSATDIAGLTVTGFETLNLQALAGPTSTAGAGGANDRTTHITGGITGATLNTINLTGTAVSIANVATTVAVTVDGSALTGDGAATPIGLTVAGSAVVGSTITGSNVKDVFTIGAEGSAYNSGSGNDSITTTIAILNADGATDGTINGGAGTDTLTVSDTTVAITDVHFTKLSNMEVIALTATAGADHSFAVGGTFNAAFANGATITTGTLANTQAFTASMGLASVNVTLTVDATSQDGKGDGKDITLTTGSGADVVTVTGDDTWTGEAADGQSIVIDTRSGNDTISVTVGTMAAQTTSQLMTITGGTGADLITKVGTNSTSTMSVASFVFASGDSGTTISTCDQITGFDMADGVGAKLSDVLDFAGTGAVGTLATSTDYGTILSHSLSGGVALFDDAAAYATALVINSTNLADVVGYLAANTATLDAIGFAYDNNGDGSNDSTMVYSNQAADSLVLLVNVTGAASLNATLTTATAGCIAIA